MVGDALSAVLATRNRAAGWWPPDLESPASTVPKLHTTGAPPSPDAYSRRAEPWHEACGMF